MSRKVVGHIGVDSGLVFISDPCYIKNHEILFNPDKWDNFCDERYGKNDDYEQTKEMCGGVVTNTANGDGLYPVYATFDEDGCVTKIEVVFQ